MCPSRICPDVADKVWFLNLGFYKEILPSGGHLPTLLTNLHEEPQKQGEVTQHELDLFSFSFNSFSLSCGTFVCTTALNRFILFVDTHQSSKFIQDTIYYHPSNSSLPSSPSTQLFNQANWQLFYTSSFLSALPWLQHTVPHQCLVNSISKISFKTTHFSLLPLVALLVQTPSCCLRLYNNLLTHFLVSYLGLIYTAELISYHSSAAVLHSSYVSLLPDFDNFSSSFLPQDLHT